MAGDRRAADRERRRDLVHGQVTGAQEAQDLPPCGVTNASKGSPAVSAEGTDSGPVSGLGPHSVFILH